MRSKRELVFYADSPWVRVVDPKVAAIGYVALARQEDGRLRVATVLLDAMIHRIGFSGHSGVVSTETFKALDVVGIEREANRISDQLAHITDRPDLKPDPVVDLLKARGRVGSDPRASVVIRYPGGATETREPAKRRPTLNSPPPGRIPDSHLRQVREFYHWAIEQDKRQGERPAPAQRIADEVGVSVHTARSWIKMARQRGLMPPGRAGHTG